MRALLWIWAALLCVAGCDRAESVRCTLQPGTLVARSTSARFDAIALASQGDRLLAAWSDASGVWLKWLDLPGAKSVRLDLRCAGGMALGLDQHEAWLGCLAPGQGGEPGTLSLNQLQGRELARALAPWRQVGRDARGVALALNAVPEGSGVALSSEQARDDSNELSVSAAWSDGVQGDPNVLIGDFPRHPVPAPGDSNVVSRSHSNAHSPTLLLHEHVAWLAWVESDLTPGKPHQRLMLKRGKSAPVLLTEVHGASVDPVLASDAGGVVLAYRAARRAGGRPELFVARLDASGRFAEPPHALGRANSVGGPSLALCEHTRAALVPLDHAGELYIAFHPLSSSLRSTEENHQYYESGRDLVSVASACVGGHPLALMAEQTDASRPGARLLSSTFRCRE